MDIREQELLDIASRHLGKVGGEGYKDSYDPSLLVAIPRSYNREAYGIKENSLPFVGGDVWNAYEVSAITKNGLPVVGMMKIYYSSNSKYHVESKSLKLYLNSFNMTRLGETREDCIRLLENRVKQDLIDKLLTQVEVKMFTHLHPGGGFYNFKPLESYINLDEIVFDSFHSDFTQLESEPEKGKVNLQITSNLLRSNCRVTSQPDWGDIYIHIRSKDGEIPKIDSIARYIVSHRQVSHFHEEICEMVYMHLKQAYSPDELMVACLYTRRGGIDINPIRASHSYLIPEFFSEINVRIDKTLRQ